MLAYDGHTMVNENIYVAVNMNVDVHDCVRLAGVRVCTDEELLARCPRVPKGGRTGESLAKVFVSAKPQDCKWA